MTKNNVNNNTQNNKYSSKKNPIKKSNSQRQLRVAREIRHTVANMILLNEIHHPDLKNYEVSIIDVNVSNDLKTCSIFIITRDATYNKKSVEVLNTLSKFITHLLIQKIKLKYAPKITFYVDENLDKINEINKLLIKINTLK